ncbi:MAG: ABC transporter permease [Chloroherpetonaceae bacterium]|nr:ABC transporter permease [Chloroherpetonaceae bacterium]
MKSVINFFSEIGETFILLWGVMEALPRMFRDRKNVVAQMAHIGVDSLPLVVLVSIFTGAIAAWQAAYQMKGLAPMSLVGGITSRVIIIELGPVLTGIIIAGRVGASIAAEIGTMKVTEQLDALDIMAISPVRYLAMPRVVATTLMMPVLVVFSNLVAVVGAFIVSSAFLGISQHVFFDSFKNFFYLEDVFGALLKASVFGLSTSLLGCHIGFRTDGGAEGVGVSTIRSFVISSAVILIADYVLWFFLF